MIRIGSLRKALLPVVVAGAMLCASSLGRTQKNGNNTPVNAGQQNPNLPPLMPDDQSTQQRARSLESEQVRMRNADRQKRLVSDTDKLLALASELKADVDKTDKDVLSIDVIRKAEEIEKLAHNVKERMKS